MATVRKRTGSAPVEDAGSDLKVTFGARSLTDLRVHGIDLGMRSIYSFGDAGPQSFTVPKTDRSQELIELRVALLCSELYSADVIFYEDPIAAGSRNLQTLIGLSQTSGCLLSAFPTDIRFYKVAVSSWKKEVVGSGKAGKLEVAAWLQENKPEMYEQCGKDQNLIDAACIYLYGKAVLSRISSVM
jgi:hypothetical protein